MVEGRQRLAVFGSWVIAQIERHTIGIDFLGIRWAAAIQLLPLGSYHCAQLIKGERGEQCVVVRAPDADKFWLTGNVVILARNDTIRIKRHTHTYLHEYAACGTVLVTSENKTELFAALSFYD